MKASLRCNMWSQNIKKDKDCALGLPLTLWCFVLLSVSASLLPCPHVGEGKGRRRGMQRDPPLQRPAIRPGSIACVYSILLYFLCFSLHVCSVS